MPKYVSVNLVGATNDIRITADSVEEKGNQIVIKNGGQIVATYYKPHVMGWQIIESPS
jgi:hypothetical protein